MYTIKEVAQKMDVSEHTLRFWAKSGFFPFVKRSKGFPNTDNPRTNVFILNPDHPFHTKKSWYDLK